MTGRRDRPDLLKWAMVSFMPAIALMGAIVDGSEKVRDASGELVWQATRNYSQIASEISLVLLTVCAVIRLSRAPASRAVMTRVNPAHLWWPALILIAQLSRGEFSVALVTAASFIVLMAAISVPWNTATVKLVVWTYGVIALATVAYAIADPERALLECRDDKCSAIGGLLTSFFPQENVLALYFLPGIVLAALATRRIQRLAVIILAGGLIYASGSRALIAAAAVAVLISIAVHWKRLSEDVRKLALSMTGLIALILTLGSAYLFFASTDEFDLTGRGDIYTLLRGFWVNTPFLGPGRGVLSLAYANGETWNYLIAHEHGQLPYLLVNGGLFAAAAFVFWVAFTLKRALNGDLGVWSQITVVLLAVLGVGFLTEPVLQFDMRSPLFWTLTVLMGTDTASTHADIAIFDHREMSWGAQL